MTAKRISFFSLSFFLVSIFWESRSSSVSFSRDEYFSKQGGGESFRKSSKAGGVGGKPNKNTKLGQLLLDNKSQKIYTTRK